MTNPEPLTLNQLRDNARKLAETRRAAESSLQDAVADAAAKEATYRRNFSERYITLRNDHSQGDAEIQAKGDCAEWSQDRDVSAGMVKVWQERLRGLEGDRSLLRLLGDWSQRIDSQTSGVG